MKLINKTILITGSTSGIGKELAERLSKDNKVFITGTQKMKLEELKSQGMKSFYCDLSSIQSIENFVMELQKEVDQIDVLFNNAGIQYNYDFMGMISPIKKVEKEIQVNTTGQIILTHLLLPLLCLSDRAMIVNTTSGLAYYPKSDGLIYSASKAAMHSFSIGLRNILKKEQIQVVEFIPPVTATKMTAHRNEAKMEPKELIDQILPQLEKGRKTATTKKIRLFLFLCKYIPQLAKKILEKNHNE